MSKSVKKKKFNCFWQSTWPIENYDKSRPNERLAHSFIYVSKTKVELNWSIIVSLRFDSTQTVCSRLSFQVTWLISRLSCCFLAFSLSRVDKSWNDRYTEQQQQQQQRKPAARKHIRQSTWSPSIGQSPRNNDKARAVPSARNPNSCVESPRECIGEQRERTKDWMVGCWHRRWSD